VGYFFDANNETSTITNSYSSGSVNGDNTVGGLVGFMADADAENKASIENSFWDTETSGLSAGVG